MIVIINDDNDNNVLSNDNDNDIINNDINWNDNNINDKIN